MSYPDNLVKQAGLEYAATARGSYSLYSISTLWREG